MRRVDRCARHLLEVRESRAVRGWRAVRAAGDVFLVCRSHDVPTLHTDPYEIDDRLGDCGAHQFQTLIDLRRSL